MVRAAAGAAKRKREDRKQSDANGCAGHIFVDFLVPTR